MSTDNTIKNVFFFLSFINVSFGFSKAKNVVGWHIGTCKLKLTQKQITKRASKTWWNCFFHVFFLFAFQTPLTLFARLLSPVHRFHHPVNPSPNWRTIRLSNIERTNPNTKLYQQKILRPQTIGKYVVCFFKRSV